MIANLSRKFGAGVLALSAAVALTACSNDEGEDTKGSAEKDAAPSSAVSAPQPTVEELNEVLNKASDPNVPTEEKVKTVEGGESAPELFDTMTQSKEESGAQFEVVDPVLPGPEPNTVMAAVRFSTPDQPDQNADNVIFVYEDGTWKLSQSWACTLITNTVPPEQVPQMCKDGNEGDAPAAPPEQQGAPAEDAPAEGAPGEGNPAEGQPGEEQPDPAQAPAPDEAAPEEGAPAPAPAPAEEP